MIKSIEALIDDVKQDNVKPTNWALRRYASAKLVEVGQLAVAPLVELLNNQNASVRAEAATALGNIGNLDAVEPLIAALNDPISNVVTVAGSALGAIKDMRAINPLIDVLHRHGADEIVSAALALGEIGSPKAQESLEEVALTAWYSDARASALYALRQVGNASANKVFVRAMNDHEEYVRIAAAESLSHSPYLQADKAAVQALDDRISYYINLMESEDKNQRKIAISSLGRIGSVRDIEPLIKHLMFDPEEDVQASTTLALGQIGDKRAVTPLVLALQNKYAPTRAFAVYALGQIDDKSVILPLSKLLQDDNENVRSEVARALSKLQDNPN